MFYKRLHEAIRILHTFFFNDGNGLKEEWLNTESYRMYEQEFSLNKVRRWVKYAHTQGRFLLKLN